jgi:hypothetical protein
MDKGKDEKAVVRKRREGMKMERAERYLCTIRWIERKGLEGVTKKESWEGEGIYGHGHRENTRIKEELLSSKRFKNLHQCRAKKE